MKAFVTGSTGLLGSNLVRLLVEQGHEVKALARSAEKARRLLGDLNIEIVVGDMENLDGFVDAMTGCDVLFHTAAYFREYYQPGDHWKILEDINIKGTVRILEAAEKRGVKKAIYVSSSGVIGRRADGKPGDETAAPPKLAEGNLYFKSKVLAEEAVYGFLKTHKLPVVMILPGWMFGPSDAAPTSAGQLVLDYLDKKIPGIVDGGGTVADARDVAQGMINAVERGRSGERYIIAGEYYNLETIGKTVEKVSGVPAPTMRIPYRILLAYAWFVQTSARLRGVETLMTVEGIRTLHYQEKISSEKAIRELGITFRPLEETLRDEVNWFRARKTQTEQASTVRVVNRA
ncbi:MAG: SDR family oxidoreductase [Chitinophagaceae bacterium]|nr:SDR family oxidoreductase [Anaerolineae bacterium]